jgi:transposase
MSERMEFVTRLSKGERMTDLCEELGISRKTGYKFWRRYQEQGVRGLEDASRAPKRVARRTSPEIEELLVKARRRKMNWGGKKLKEVLEYRQPGLKLPSASTIAAILKRRGLVSGRKRRRVPEAYSGALTQPEAPNGGWTTKASSDWGMGATATR